MVKYEFDTREELHEAMKHLEDYHDCDKCHGKIVGISMDNLGNSCCAYCGEIVRYPKLKREVLEREMKLLIKND